MSETVAHYVDCPADCTLTVHEERDASLDLRPDHITVELCRDDYHRLFTALHGIERWMVAFVPGENFMLGTTHGRKVIFVPEGRDQNVAP